VRSYPGFFAIAAYRVAHQLHKLGIKVIPRIITEHAHHKTGIDIHPAATIGHSFCIDHGTGIVIGETAVIGNHVKLYQIVYANATILGGQTVIGHHCVIGGNSWITKSVEPYSTVYYIAGNNQVEKIKEEI